MMKVSRYRYAKWMGMTVLALMLASPLEMFAAEPLTITQAQKAALEANPRLLAAKLDAVAASHKTKEALGKHFGTIDAVGMYNYYERDRIVVPMAVELFANPSLGMSQLPWDRNQWHYGFVWEIPLLTGGSLYEGDYIARLS